MCVSERERESVFVCVYVLGTCRFICIGGEENSLTVYASDTCEREREGGEREKERE